MGYIRKQKLIDSAEILEGLSLGIRERNPDLIFKTLQKVPDLGAAGTILSVIKELVTNNRSAIVEEFKMLQAFEHARWLMDPSFTSLFSLLCDWAGTGKSLEVYCDDSKPLAQLVPELRARVSAKPEDFKMPSGNTVNIFSLAKEIEFKNSKLVPGLQLADVVASASNFAINNPSSEFASQMGAALYEGISPKSMCPYSQRFTAEQRERLNGWLIIIAKSQLKGMSPCERFRFLIEKAQHLGKHSK